MSFCPNFFGQTLLVWEDGRTNRKYILRLVGLARQTFMSTTAKCREEVHEEESGVARAYEDSTELDAGGNMRPKYWSSDSQRMITRRLQNEKSDCQSS